MKIVQKDIHVYHRLKMQSQDTYCCRNYHRISFEYFGRCFCACIEFWVCFFCFSWVEIGFCEVAVSVIGPHRANAKSGNFLIKILWLFDKQTCILSLSKSNPIYQDYWLIFKKILQSWWLFFILKVKTFLERAKMCMFGNRFCQSNR